MPDPNDKIKVLYDAVSKDYNLGSLQEFKTKLQDPSKRKAFYDGVGSEYALGSFDEFEGKIGVKKKDQSIPQSQTPSQPSQSGGQQSPSKKYNLADYESTIGRVVNSKKALDRLDQSEKGPMGFSIPSATTSGGYSRTLASKEYKESMPLLKDMERKYADVLSEVDNQFVQNYKNFVTPSGNVDEGALRNEADRLSKEYGAGSGVKEVIYNRAKQKVQFEVIRPDVEAENDKLWKEKFGKTSKEFFEGKNSAKLNEYQQTQEQLKTRLTKEQSNSQEVVNTKTDKIFNEKYAPTLQEIANQYGADSTEFKKASSDAKKSLVNDQREIIKAENKRLARLNGEIQRSLSERFEKLKEEVDLSKEDEEKINSIYGQAYKNVVEKKVKDKEVVQRLIDSAPGGRAITFMKSLMGGLVGGLASKGEGLVSAGMNNRFTDLLRNLSTTAGELETVDYELKGTNLINPTTYLTRGGKMLGNQLPMMAATMGASALGQTAGVVIGGLAGFADETLQVSGDVYKQAKDEGFSESDAQQKASNFAENNTYLLPLYFLGSLGILKGMKGAKGFVAGTAMELVEEEGTELPQGYFQQKESKDAKSLGRYVKEDAANTAIETAIGVLFQGGTMSAMGDMYNALGKKAKGAESQHYANIIKEQGAQAANAIAEEQFLNGAIDETQLADAKAKVEKVSVLTKDLTELGVPEPAQKLYISATEDLAALEQKMASLADPNLIAKVANEITEKKQYLSDIVDGKVSMSEVILPNGHTFTIDTKDIKELSKDDELGKYVKAGVVKINKVGEKAQETKDEATDAEDGTASMDEKMSRLSGAKAEIDAVLGGVEKDRIKSFIDKEGGNLSGIEKSMAEADPKGFMESIAQQAQGFSMSEGKWVPVGEGGNAEQTMIGQGYSPKLIQEAKKMFPASKMYKPVAAPEVKVQEVKKTNPISLKLSNSFVNTQEVDNAVNEIRSLGETNELNDKQVLIDGVKVNIERDGGKIWLKEISSIEQGKGRGTKVLNKIKQISDKSGIDIVLHPSQISNTTGEQLNDWYKKNGFEDYTQGRLIYKSKEAQTDNTTNLVPRTVEKRKPETSLEEIGDVGASKTKNTPSGIKEAKVAEVIPDKVQKKTEVPDTNGVDKSEDALELEKEAKLKQVGKPDVSLNTLSNKELVDSKDPIANKSANENIRKRQRELERLINCLWT